MRAFAIYAGGGVKGAALAGCLCAAEQQGVKFVGHGGTSAGSMIALMAAVGYGGEEMEKILVEELDFRTLLEDQGQQLGQPQRRHVRSTRLHRITGPIAGSRGNPRAQSRSAYTRSE